MAWNSSAQKMLQLRYRLLRQREHVARWRDLVQAVCPFRFAAWMNRTTARQVDAARDALRLIEPLEPRVLLSSAVVSPVVPNSVVVTEVGPEIVVRGLKGRGVADNDTTPSLGNGTYFGEAAVGSSITRTFTVQNIGNQTLTLGELRIAAAHADDFECLSAPAQSILPGGATTFTIRFTPSATGVRYGAITFTNNDSDENPFNFSIRGVGLVPEVNVAFDGTNLPDNDTTPSAAEGTSFGGVEVGDFSDHTFTITNTGEGTLVLGAFEFAATHAADFSVVDAPDATVAAGQSTTFTVRFAPGATGTRFGAFKIATNDSDENPYNFALRGTGLQSEIAVTGNGVEIAAGDFSPSAADDTAWTDVPIGGFEDHTFTIRNDGTAPLDIGSVSVTGPGGGRFSVISQPAPVLAPDATTTFTVRFSPTDNLLQTAFVNFTNSDADESLYTFFVSGLGEGDSEIDVEVDGVPTARGGTIDFGDLVLGDASFSTITIYNNGTDDLQITDVDIVGSDLSDFAIIQSPDSLVAPGDSTDMIVQFFPGSVGAKFAGMRIFNNDADEDPYNFALRGGVGTPEIAIDFGGQGIIDGDPTPSTLEGTDFGHIEVGDTVDRTFTIHNNGTAVLNISGATAVGSGFSMFTQPASQVAPGGSTTFTVRYAPFTGGTTNGAVSILSNDSDESLFTFSLLGQAGFQEIAVSGTKGRAISDGDISPSSGDGTSLGTLGVGESTTQTFTIHNVGTAVLNISGVTITGTNADDFAVVGAPAASVAAGGSTSVTIQGTAAGGVSFATVNIANDDSDENPFSFDVRIASSAPEANLFFNSPSLVPVADNDTSRTTANGTNFGTVNVGQSVDYTYTLANPGTQALTVGAISIVGGNADQFSVVTQPATTVGVNSNTTFTIRFTPTSNGGKFAGITFATNDANENPYNFAITGTGAAAVAPAEIEVSHMGTPLTDGDSTPSTAEGTDFGTIAVGTTVDRTFRIDNTGGQTLNISGVSFVGANASDFTVLSAPDAAVAGGGFTTFTVRFSPGAALGRFAAMIINSDDADEAVFNVSITGQGAVGTGMPMVVVRGNGIGIADDDTTPTTADGTDFGVVDVTTTFRNQEFTVTNAGGGTLSLSGLTITGTDAADFSIPVGLSSASLTGGQSATFTVRFDPSSAGFKNANLQLVTNDDTVAVFNAAITGNGQNLTQQEVRTNFGSTTILDGDTTPSAAEGTDFGSTDVGTGVQRTFTITNTGPAASSLTLATVTISGANAADFTVITQPTGPLAGATSSNFVIEFNPTAAGVRNATVSFNNNDADEDPYDFAITGNGMAVDPVAEVTFQDNGQFVPDSTTTPADTPTLVSNGTDFGSVSVGSTVSHTFVLTNTGPAGSSLGRFTIVDSPDDGSAFTVTGGAVGTPLASGESETFTVNFTPPGAGTFIANITFINDDPNANPYNFAITGMGIAGAPTIQVDYLGTPLTDGDNTPSGPEGTDYSSININGGFNTRTYTITNTGTGTLDLSGGITITGSDAADWSITVPPANTMLAAAESTTFVAEFDPSDQGNRFATINIMSNDATVPVFDFAVSGFGAAPDVSLELDFQPVNQFDEVDFGPVADGQTRQLTLFISNAGQALLTISSIAIEGIDAADFTIITLPDLTLNPGQNDIITVEFTPSRAGIHDAGLRINSDDPDEPGFLVNLAGEGLAATQFALDETIGIPSLPGADVGADKMFETDLDGDGDLDIVVMVGDVLTWFDNNGDGEFTQRDLSNFASDPGEVLYPADVDGDGDIDLVATFYDYGYSGSTAVTWLENDGNENFTRRDVDRVATPYAEVIADDLDGDGDTDLIVLEDDLETISWYENDGAENFTRRIVTTLPNAGENVYGLEVSDIDGDGDNDFIIGTSNYGSINRLVWLENDGSENFTPNEIAADPVAQPSWVDVTDMDGDGDLDIVVSTYDYFSYIDSLVWFENDGSQNFTERLIANDNSYVTGMRAVDVDRDGDVDVLAVSQNGSYSTEAVTWYENDGSQNFTPMSIGAVPNAPVDVIAADFDGDGDIDVVVGARDTGNSVVYYGNLSGAEADVDFMGVEVKAGDITPSSAEGTDFGDVQGGSTVQRTFTISNNGTADLLISNFGVSGTSDWAVVTPPGTVVTPGNFTTFTVAFNANQSNVGQRIAGVSFTTNDANESPYQFALTAFTTNPEIGVSGNDSFILSGDTTPDTADFTDFGDILNGGHTRDFVILNGGTTNLEISSILITGPDSGNFQIVQDPGGVIAPGESSVLRIAASSSVVGAINATVSINHNDNDDGENPFTFDITANRVASVATNNYIGPSLGVWETGANWSEGVAPSAGQRADVGMDVVVSSAIQADIVYMSAQIQMQNGTTNFAGNLIDVDGGSVLVTGNTTLTDSSVLAPVTVSNGRLTIIGNVVVESLNVIGSGEVFVQTNGSLTVLGDATASSPAGIDVRGSFIANGNVFVDANSALDAPSIAETYIQVDGDLTLAGLFRINVGVGRVLGDLIFTGQPMVETVNGAAIFFSNTTLSTTAVNTGASTVEIFHANGADSLIDLSQVTTWNSAYTSVSGGVEALIVHAEDGGRIDLSGVTALTTSLGAEDQIIFRTSLSPSSMIDLSSLVTYSGSGKVVLDVIDGMIHVGAVDTDFANEVFVGATGMLHVIGDWDGVNTVISNSITVEASALNTFGRIMVEGNADINGDFNINFIDGYMPSIGDTFDIFAMQFNDGRPASFANVTGLAAGTTDSLVFTSGLLIDILTIEIVAVAP